MKILLACEESQRVCQAFRDKGHEAYSCDVLETSGNHPEWHIQGDVLPLLEEKWDMIIAFPPCTYLSNAGACRLYPKKGELNQERYQLGLEGKAFFMEFYNANCDKIAIENPVPSKVYGLPPYTQTIQPWEHRHPYTKKTCLWLQGLPKLRPSDIFTGETVSWVSGGSKDHNGEPRKNKGTKIRDSRRRSKTFEGIAKAMADQWG